MNILQFKNSFLIIDIILFTNRIRENHQGNAQNTDGGSHFLGIKFYKYK